MAKNDNSSGQGQFTGNLNMPNAGGNTSYLRKPQMGGILPGLIGGMGQWNPQGMSGNAGSMWNQPGLLGQPDASQLIREFINPSMAGNRGPMATIGSGIGGLYF